MELLNFFNILNGRFISGSWNRPIIFIILLLNNPIIISGLSVLNTKSYVIYAFLTRIYQARLIL